MAQRDHNGPDRPPPSTLSPGRVRALLSWLSPRAQLPGELVEQVPDAITGGVLEPSDSGGPPRLTFPDGRRTRLRVDTPCYCEFGIAHGFCQHRAAVLIWLLWHRPDGRPLFDQPLWQLEFDYLSRAPSQVSPSKSAPAPKPRSDRRCRLLVAVFPTGGYARGFDLELRLVRANKRGDGWLKPIRCPTKLETLRTKAAPSEAQAQVVDLVDQLAELVKIDSFARKAPRLRAGLAHKLLAALAAGCERGPDHPERELELSWGDLSITASATPWRPTLRLSPGPPGQLEVRWVEHVLDHWQLSPSIVLTSDQQLRPLADDIPASLLARIRAEPVHVDTREFAAFARTILAHAIVPVEIVDPNELGATAIERREARVYLEEREDVLRCTAKLAYELRDGRCLEFELHDRRSLSFDDDLDLVRAVDWEDARREDFTTRVSRTQGSVELIGEEAWTFLSETLEQLRERGWVAFGEANLKRNRVAAEPLRPHMRIGPSTDWFELEVDFIAEGRGGQPGERLAPVEVIESWLAGHRFVRLADERVAALPKDWLERHGRALAELLELGRDSEGRLGAHALPLASELLEGLALADEAPDQVARASHWRSRARALTSFEGVASREPPALLQATLRDYQRRGYAWLCFLRDHGLGGCLADDMGLGKTVQTLALLLDTHTRDPAGPASLIVCPTSVLHAWTEQAARFTPALRLHVHHGPRRGTPPPDGELDAIVTSYALLRQDVELWQSRRFRHLVLDEAQALKNPDSQLARAARSLEAAHPVALSGTPLENHVAELWSLFEILMPGFFGSRRRFRSRWVDPIHKREDAATLARLRRRLRPFLLRRLKREVAAELPPKQTQVLRCRLARPQRLLYERVRHSYRASVFGAVDQRGVGGATLHILEALTRLRQACCHPALLPFPEAEAVAHASVSPDGSGVAKLELLRLLLRQAIAEGHRSLVFSQWPSFLDHVAQMLDAAGIAHLRLDGSTRDRGAVLERWRAPSGPPVFLISTKAGGVGLDLTEADHVFHLDPWWNPASEDQATDRAHRIGQTRPVMVYKLVAADTVEDKILELQARKRRLFEATVDAERLAVDELSRADLEAVFMGDTAPEALPYAPLEAGALTADDADPRALAELTALPTALERPGDAPPPAAPAPQDTGAPVNAEDTDDADVIELFPRPR